MQQTFGDFPMFDILKTHTRLDLFRALIQLFSLCCRVRLLVNRQTEEAVAVKVIDTSQAKECAENVKKEVCVHKVSCSPLGQLV